MKPAWQRITPYVICCPLPGNGQRTTDDVGRYNFRPRYNFNVTQAQQVIFNTASVTRRPALGRTVRIFNALSGVRRSIKPDAYLSSFLRHRLEEPFFHLCWAAAQYPIIDCKKCIQRSNISGLTNDAVLPTLQEGK